MSLQYTLIYFRIKDRNTKHKENWHIQIIHMSQQVILLCHQPLAHRHTHTHTHTYIYIYIYIYWLTQKSVDNMLNNVYHILNCIYLSIFSLKRYHLAITYFWRSLCTGLYIYIYIYRERERERFLQSERIYRCVT